MTCCGACLGDGGPDPVGWLPFACPMSSAGCGVVVGLARPPLFHEQVGVQMMETVSRHLLVLTGVGKTTRDAFLRHFAHPHVRGTPPSPSPPVSKPISAVGCAPVPFCSSPPSRSAWATKGFFFFQSPSSSPEMPPPWSRINTGAVRVPPTQPKGSASGPTLRTTGSVALVLANHGPLFTSSPARFIRSRPLSAPQPHAAAGSSAMAASGAPLNTGPGAWQRRRMKDSRSWRRVQPGTLASWADKAAWSEWVGAGVGVDRGKEQGDEVERASHKMA